MLNQWENAFDTSEVHTQIGPTPLHDHDVPLVIVDFDATLHPYMQAIMLHPDCPAVDLTTLTDYYHFHELIGGKDNLVKIATDDTAFDRMIQAGLYEGANEAMQKLAQVANVIIMTHRPLSHGPTIANALKEFGTPHMFLMAGAVDKVEFCKSHGVTMLIDDKPTTLQKAFDHGLKTATLTHSYNKQIANDLAIPTAEHWDDLISHVLELIHE